MKELLDWAFVSINFPLTLLLLVILLYWLTVIIGLLDFSFLNFEVDADIDLHLHAHAGVHLEKNIHVDVKAKQSLFTTLLSFFNLGRVPFMIFLSFMVLFMWSGSILGNYYLNNQSVGFALLLLIPNFVISLFLTKFVTFPLIHVFSDGKNEFEANSDIIGKPCTLLLSATEQKVGQAEVLSATGAPLLLTVKTTTGHQLKRGERGLVIDYDQTTHTYLIEPFDQ